MTGMTKGFGRAFGAVRNLGNTASRRFLTAAVTAGVAGFTLASPAAYAGPGEGDRYYRPAADRDGYRGERFDRPGYDDDHDRRADAKVRVDADDFGFRIRVGEPAPRRERVWVEPVYRMVCDKVWVEPVYRDECERIWIEPVYREACDRVWVPARVEVCYVDRIGHHGRVYRERVERVVAPGHFEEVRRRELVSPGRWEERPRRVLVAAGYFRTVERQELVSAGHWEWRTVGGGDRRSEFGVYARSRN